MTTDEAKAAARERWGRSTAFRVGSIMGEEGAPCEPPAEYSPRMAEHFRCGHALGLERRTGERRP